MLLYRTLFLVHALALVHAIGLQPRTYSKRAPSHTTISILEKMTDIQADNACKFPPISVLQDLQTFAFFEECKRQLPAQFTPHSPAEDVRCMGLYEIGLRLCNVIAKYQLPSTVIPSDPNDFKKFVTDPHQTESNSKLCLELGSSPLPEEQEEEGLEAWSMVRIFKGYPKACPQTCFYLDENAREICRLVLWGNSLFLNVSQIASKQAQSSSVPKDSNSEVAEEPLEIPPEDNNRRIPETGVEQLSTRQGVQNLPQKDPPSVKVFVHGSSNDDSQNLLPSRSVEVTDDQNPHPKQDTNESKHSLPESLPVEGGIADQVDHPEATVSVTHKKELTNINAKEKEIKQTVNIGNKRLLKKVQTGKDLPKNQDAVSQEASMDSDHVKVKVTSQEVASAPASAPASIASEVPIAPESPIAVEAPIAAEIPIAAEEPIAPETPDEIVQDTASNPSIDANQDTDYPNSEHMEDDDSMHFEPPAKAEENINGDDEFPKPRENIDDQQFVESEDSHFFRYFMTMVVICIFGYLLFHNKQKILALFLEGRSRRGTRRRPNTANYHKLDCNLEEAVSSPCSTSVAHVIY